MLNIAPGCPARQIDYDRLNVHCHNNLSIRKNGWQLQGGFCLNRTKDQGIQWVTERLHACLKWLCSMDQLVSYLHVVIEQIMRVFKILHKRNHELHNMYKASSKKVCFFMDLILFPKTLRKTKIGKAKSATARVQVYQTMCSPESLYGPFLDPLSVEAKKYSLKRISVKRRTVFFLGWMKEQGTDGKASSR
jgi:hypothetical protein